MNTQISPNQRGQELLVRMGQIPVIVQGKLSERWTAGKITGHKLQRWRGGHNQTRHIPAQLVERVRQGTQGYAQFLRLVQEYVAVRETDALQNPTDSKKKSTKP
jgi:hypothetical protein